MLWVMWQTGRCQVRSTILFIHVRAASHCSNQVQPWRVSHEALRERGTESHRGWSMRRPWRQDRRGRRRTRRRVCCSWSASVDDVDEDSDVLPRQPTSSCSSWLLQQHPPILAAPRHHKQSIYSFLAVAQKLASKYLNSDEKCYTLIVSVWDENWSTEFHSWKVYKADSIQ